MGNSIGSLKSTSERENIRPLLLTIPQVMDCMGLGRNKVYDLIQKEGLPVLRFGRSVRVSYTGLQRWLEQREQAGTWGLVYDKKGQWRGFYLSP